MKIDWTKLRAAIKHDTETIRTLKANGSRGSALAMKTQATRHHAIAAHMRSHIHLSGKFLCNPYWIGQKHGPYFWKPGMTLEEQGKFIEEELKQFILPEEVAPAAQPAA